MAETTGERRLALKISSRLVVLLAFVDKEQLLRDPTTLTRDPWGYHSAARVNNPGCELLVAIGTESG